MAQQSRHHERANILLDTADWPLCWCQPAGEKTKGKGANGFVLAPLADCRSQEFTCFSYDDQHNFHLGDSSLKYYYTPRLGADLSRGFDTFEKQDDSKAEHLDSLLKTIAAHEKATGKKIDANLVTWRGMMTKVVQPVPASPSRHERQGLRVLIDHGDSV